MLTEHNRTTVDNLIESVPAKRISDTGYIPTPSGKKEKCFTEMITTFQRTYGMNFEQSQLAASHFRTEALNKLKNSQEKQESDRPTPDSWRPGMPYPEYLEPIEMAKLLFGQLEVSPSGCFVFSEKKGVPSWLLSVGPSLTVKSTIKEFDIKAGVSAEVRKYKKFRTEDERKCQHTMSVQEVLENQNSCAGEMRRVTLRRIANEIAFDKKLKNKGAAELVKFIKQYNVPKVHKETECDEMVRLHFLMLCHFLWCVKRRLNGKRTVFEIMPVFLGRQGIGKSFSATRISEAIPNIATKAKIKELTDTRETRRWENYFLAFLDEVSKETKDSLATLKEWITKIDGEFRPLNTNSSEYCLKNAQAIGTSNFPLSTILKDASGMRRFWEIPSDQPANTLLKGMENIDWILIYKSINENNEMGYYGPDSLGKDYYDQITAIQNLSRDRSPVEIFLADHGFMCEEGGLDPNREKIWFPVVKMREAFNAWADAQTWGKYTSKAFSNELSSLYMEKKVGSGNKLVVELNAPMIPEDSEGYWSEFNEYIISEDN